MSEYQISGLELLLQYEIGGGDSINCQGIRNKLALQIYQENIKCKNACDYVLNFSYRKQYIYICIYLNKNISYALK